MQIYQNSKAIGVNLTTPFTATGGASPYTYSVLSGGAGGSISGSGLYTSPTAYGTDTIVAVDANTQTAIATIMVGSPLMLFCDIIQTAMGLSPGQVYLWDQKINIPEDSNLYVAVGVMSVKPFASSNILDANGNSIQNVNCFAMLSVDLMSRSLIASEQKEQLILALASNYSQQQQELNGLLIARLSSGFVNISDTDGAAILYRYNINLGLQYLITKTSAVAYYDNFSAVAIAPNP
jgi:hypothetical protein